MEENWARGRDEVTETGFSVELHVPLRLVTSSSGSQCVGGITTSRKTKRKTPTDASYTDMCDCV